MHICIIIKKIEQHHFSIEGKDDSISIPHVELKLT